MLLTPAYRVIQGIVLKSVSEAERTCFVLLNQPVDTTGSKKSSLKKYAVRYEREAAWLTQISSAARIAVSIFSGVVNGAKRLSGFPSRPIRNFVKFHLIRLPSTPGNSFFR